MSLENLEGVQHFLTQKLRTPVSDLDVLTPGWRCRVLAFKAGGHHLIFKMSRNGDTLFQEDLAARQWAHLLPVPPVLQSGHSESWRWVIQARCPGTALEVQWSLAGFQTLMKYMRSFHEQPGQTDLRDWHQHLVTVHGFTAHELPENSRGLDRDTFVSYCEALKTAAAIYMQERYTKIVPIHGDLKPAHVFVKTSPRAVQLTGIIDWEMQREGDFLYDWGVFLLHMPIENQREALQLLAQAFPGCEQRLTACILHSALGGLFMLSQSKMFDDYRQMEQRLLHLLDQINGLDHQILHQ